MAINDSELSLHNPSNNVTTKIKVAGFPAPNDFKVNIVAKPGIKLSRKRLDSYKSGINDFLNQFNTGGTTPSSLVNPISIKTFYQDGEYIDVEFSNFSSPLLLPLASIQYQIATNNSFNNIVVNQAVHVTNNNVSSLRVTTTGLNPGDTYYFRVRYGAGGENSIWSDVRAFTVNRPTLPKPVIEPFTDANYIYKDTIPFDVTVNVVAQPLTTSNHDSSTWRIYEKRNDQFVEIWTKQKSATDLNTLQLSSMYPNILHYNKTYYVSVVYYSNNVNTEFSYESDLVPFCANKVTIKPVENITVYPSIVNVANPVLGFNEAIYAIINGKEKTLEYGNIEKIYWELSSGTFKVTNMTTTNTYNLPAGTLLPNRTYKLKIYYYHTYLGESEPAYFEFTTEKEFISFRDNLTYPVKTYDGMAYYGDIPYAQLMNPDIKYGGVFASNRSYNIGEEVSYNGELYICKKKTPSTSFTITEYFIKSDSTEAEQYYKSGLPTYSWLVDRVGLNPNLCTRDILSGNTNILNADVGGWVKCQNVQGKIIYITKTPIYNGVSVNDLIKADLYHPRRKTIRIADSLYYVRLLSTEMNIGYDALDPVTKNGSLNFDYGTTTVDYKEDSVITNLISGKLASFTTTDLDISTTDNKELVYSSTALMAYKIDTQSGMTFLGRSFNSPDDRRYSIRLVLELIPEANKPVYNMSPRIPGPGLTLDENGNPLNYDKYLDGAYLGTVEVSDFLTSLAINEKTGLYSNNVSPNRLWHKFYYKGLIYFLSQGTNLSQVEISSLEDRNIIHPTPLFVLQDGSVQATNGKIVFNNVIYNVCCPQVLNHDYQHIVIKNSKNMPHDILNPGTANQDIYIADNCFLSDMVYPIYMNQLTSADDPRQIPYNGAKGFKGRYKSVSDTSVRIIDNLGSCNKTDYDSTFLTCQTFMGPSGDDNYVLNGQRDIYTMAEHNGTDPVDVIFCLTVNPTIDSLHTWKK